MKPKVDISSNLHMGGNDEVFKSMDVGSVRRRRNPP